MNVSLTPELEQFIDYKVKSGFYGSASEVIREGLRLLDEQDTIKKKRIEMLNLEIDKGLSSLKSDNIISDVELKEHIEDRRQKFREQNG